MTDGRGPWGLRRQYRDVPAPEPVSFAARAADVVTGLAFLAFYGMIVGALWPLVKLWDFVRSRHGPYVLVAVAALGGARLAWLRAHWDFPIDFQLYWLAAKHWSDPYNPLLMHSAEAQALFPKTNLALVHLPYYYPPPAMLLSWPLSLLPMNLAYMLFSAVGAAFAMTLAVRRVRWLAVLLFLSAPLFYGAFIGQIGLLIGCIAILAFEVMDSRPELAGMLLAVMICIKPQSAFLAPLVLWGRWTALRAMVETAAFLVLVSLLFGPERWIEWYRSIGRFGGEIQPIVPKIMPYLLFGWGPWWRVTLVVIGAAFAFCDRSLRGFLVGTLLCTPYFQLYDLVGFSFLGLLIVAEWKLLGPLRGLAPGAFGLALIVCPAWSETLTLFCAGLIGSEIVRLYWRQFHATTIMPSLSEVRRAVRFNSTGTPKCDG